MIKIRLARHGSKKRPFYRIVCTDEKRKLTGKPLAVLGFWHPGKNQIRVDYEKLQLWESIGAIKTPAVKKLLKK